MATHSPFIMVPPSLAPTEPNTAITPSLSIPNAEPTGTLPIESLHSTVTPQTSAPRVPLDQPPAAPSFIPSTSPESPIPASTGIQLFSSYGTPSPGAPPETPGAALVNAPVFITPASKTFRTSVQLFSCYTTPSPAAPTKVPAAVSTSAPTDKQDSLQDAPTSLQEVSSSATPGDKQTKNNKQEGEPPALEIPSPTLPTLPSAPASCSESTPVTETPCNSQEQKFPGISNEEVNFSETLGEELPRRPSSLVAEVHRSQRFTPRAFLRHTSGLPPPSYAEAVSSKEGPTPTHWVNRLGDRPPNYSAPLPRVATAIVTTRPERGTHRRASCKPEVWGPYPTRASCSRCRRIGLSHVVAEDVEFTHLCALALCLLGCWPCCLLPYCMSSCRRVWHVCPRCGHYMGVYYPRPPAVHSDNPAASETNV